MTTLNNRDRYELEFERAYNAAVEDCERSAESFAEVLGGETILDYAFMSVSAQERLIAYRLDPKRIQQRVQIETRAAMALWQIWMRLDSAQTENDRAIGAWLSQIVHEAARAQAERHAESGIEDHYRRAGAI